jgi:hypothetical protein
MEAVEPVRFAMASPTNMKSTTTASLKELEREFEQILQLEQRTPIRPRALLFSMTPSTASGSQQTCTASPDPGLALREPTIRWKPMHCTPEGVDTPQKPPKKLMRRAVVSPMWSPRCSPSRRPALSSVVDRPGRSVVNEDKENVPMASLTSIPFGSPLEGAKKCTTIFSPTVSSKFVRVAQFPLCSLSQRHQLILPVVSEQEAGINRVSCEGKL